MSNNILHFQFEKKGEEAFLFTFIRMAAHKGKKLAFGDRSADTDFTIDSTSGNDCSAEFGTSWKIDTFVRSTITFRLSPHFQAVGV
jgi:hypothetical protein